MTVRAPVRQRPSMQLPPIGGQITGISKASGQTHIAKAIEDAVGAYLSLCAGRDELRPETGDCLDSFGFGASLLELLEVVAIYHPNLSSQARRHVVDHFDCGKLKWVNRREFWSRGVGGLIGAYLVTGDGFFFDTAQKCALKALNTGPFGPFINLATRACRPRPLGDSAGWADLSAGIPELSALVQLSHSPKLEEHLRKRLTMMSGWTLRSPVDVSGVAVLSDLATAYAVSEDPGILKLLSGVNVTFLIHENASLLYPLVRVAHYLGDRVPHFKVWNVESIEAFGLRDYSPPAFKSLSTKGSTWLGRFRFDATLLLTWLASGKHRDVIEKTVLMTVTECRCGKGFCGLTSSNTGRVLKDNIQHSEFLGQWLKAGILLGMDSKLVQNFVFNERGHVIRDRNHY